MTNQSHRNFRWNSTGSKTRKREHYPTRRKKPPPPPRGNLNTYACGINKNTLLFKLGCPRAAWGLPPPLPPGIVLQVRRTCARLLSINEQTEGFIKQICFFLILKLILSRLNRCYNNLTHVRRLNKNVTADRTILRVFLASGDKVF